MLVVEMEMMVVVVVEMMLVVKMKMTPYEYPFKDDYDYDDSIWRNMWSNFKNFSTSVMWRNMKCLHITDVENFRFIHICDEWKSEISPHDNDMTNMRYGNWGPRYLDGGCYHLISLKTSTLNS